MTVLIVWIVVESICLLGAAWLLFRSQSENEVLEEERNAVRRKVTWLTETLYAFGEDYRLAYRRGHSRGFAEAIAGVNEGRLDGLIHHRVSGNIHGTIGSAVGTVFASITLKESIDETEPQLLLDFVDCESGVDSESQSSAGTAEDFDTASNHWIYGS